MTALKSYLVTSTHPTGKETTHISRSVSIQECARIAPLYIAANKLGALKSIHQLYPGTTRRMINGESAEMVLRGTTKGKAMRLEFNAVATGKQAQEATTSIIPKGGKKKTKKAKKKSTKPRRKVLGKSIADITADTAAQGDVIPLAENSTARTEDILVLGV